MTKSICLLLMVAALPAIGQTLPSMDNLKSDDAMAALESAAGGSLSSLLQDQLNLTSDQAEGGIGSLLSLANEKLNAGEFDKLAGMIPGADGYLEAAKNLGAITGPLKSVGDLNQSLSALGITPETIEKFVPMVTQYLGTIGGDEAKALLGQLLG